MIDPILRTIVAKFDPLYIGGEVLFEDTEDLFTTRLIQALRASEKSISILNTDLFELEESARSEFREIRAMLSANTLMRVWKLQASGVLNIVTNPNPKGSWETFLHSISGLKNAAFITQYQSVSTLVQFQCFRVGANFLLQPW